MKVFAYILLMPVLMLSDSASAQTVWRCGPDGRTYSQKPCAEGRTVSTDDSRAAEDLAQALRIAKREQALADTMRQERLLRETALPPGAGLASLGPWASSPTTGKPNKGLHAHGKTNGGAHGENLAPKPPKTKTNDGKTPPANHFTALSANPA